MNALYWFALVVGAGMFLVSLAGDLFGGGDVDIHADADLDVDLSMDADADVHVDSAGHSDAAGFKILSIRNATYFMFAFGVSGVLLTLLQQGRQPLLTAAVAIGLGVMGGAISSLAFGWVKRTESGDLPGDRGWIGLIGRVTLPLSVRGTGKIIVSREGREQELLARPFDREPDRPEEWRRVLVIGMEQGVALVAPGDPALDNPGMPRIAPNSEA